MASAIMAPSWFGDLVNALLLYLRGKPLQAQALLDRHCAAKGGQVVALGRERTRQGGNKIPRTQSNKIMVSVTQDGII